MLLKSTHLRGVDLRRERRRRLVRQPRRTLNWRRVIRWSGESGKMILAEGDGSKMAGFGVAGW